MHFKHLLATTAIAALAATVQAQPKENVKIATGKYEPTWESTAQWECPEWYKDAKFGIWAHWGPQCEPEYGDWYARYMYAPGTDQYNYHVAHYGDPNEYGLKELCRDWKAENWDPERLVALYKSVGARYFFTLGNHHDNFDLWNSPYQEWNTLRMGPERDVVGEWAKACENNDLPLGISFHAARAWLWLELAQNFDGNLTKEDGIGKWWEGLDPQALYAQRHEPSRDFSNPWAMFGYWDWYPGTGWSVPTEEYKMNFQNRTLQCINDYQPDVIYFDDTVLPFYGADDQIGLNILAHYYNKRIERTGKEDVVVTGKILNEQHKKSLLWDVERGIPDRMQEKYWQTCTCIGDWHYSRPLYERNGYKSAQHVINMLVDVVSKNGNLLMSVPLRGDGTIDEKEEAILQDIKAWMDVNSRSIYGTRVWKTFGEGPLAEAVNPMSGPGFNESINYTSADVRYNIKYAKSEAESDTLFATVMRWPSQGTFKFKFLGRTSDYFMGEVQSAELLGYDGTIDCTLDIDGLTVTMPKPCNKIAPVYAFTFKPGTDQPLTLTEAIDHFDALLPTLHTGYNTGSLSAQAVATFAQAVEAARLHTDDNTVNQKQALQTLLAAWKELKDNGSVQPQAPAADGTDRTVELLIEASNFTRTDDTKGKRFGKPLNWTVENYSVPDNENRGIMEGTDNWPSFETLYLGVWDNRDAATCDLSNARIYRRLHLEAGQWYFGASFNANHNLTDAYLFVAPDLCETHQLPLQAIAYAPISKLGFDNIMGLSFTLDREQDVVLGFQADLAAGAAEQEFRAKEVRLVYYGEMTHAKLTQLMDEAQATLDGAQVSTNTGNHTIQSADALRQAIALAQQTGADAAAEQIAGAISQLTAALEAFAQSRNPGGQPGSDPCDDVTVEVLSEADHFARADQSTTRFAAPKYWTVENYSVVPVNGSHQTDPSQGTKQGIDHNPGYDCLYLGLWNDRQNAAEGIDLSNARLYQRVSLKAGRYYFGARYNTTWDMTPRGYIFVADQTYDTDELPERALAHYAIQNAVGGDNGPWWGITFTLPEDKEVLLGWQIDLATSSAVAEARMSSICLLYYGNMTHATLTDKVAEVEEAIAELPFDDNTGHYNRIALQPLSEALAAAKAVAQDAPFAEIDAAYTALTEAYQAFLWGGRNAGGQPIMDGATDITVRMLSEAKDFARTEETSATRWGHPANWTVENYSVTDGTNGVMEGLDNYPGSEHLYLGVWNNRGNNRDGDLHDARLYQSVTLPAGRYYFGAAYETNHWFHQIYLLAAADVLSTHEVETEAIAFDNAAVSADGKFHGIYFTLPQEQEVVLGWQANLAEGNNEQEFRCSEVKLLGYDWQEDEDGVEQIVNSQLSNCKYYDLLGRRIVSPRQHGIYIVNGKKYVR